MGLNIGEIIPKKEISVKELSGKIFCVDAFNVLYQFLSSIRQMDGTPLMDKRGNVTSHLSGIFYRNISLLVDGLKLIYVFDGKPPELKEKIHEVRQKTREIAFEKYESAKKEGDLDAMKRYSSQLVRLNDEMINESKELLEAMGILVVQAPGEGEAEASFLTKKPEIYSVVSQDYDSLLFGAKRLIQNLTISRRRKTAFGYKEIFPVEIELSNVLSSLEIDLDQLICLGILVGTDYNPKGVPGIGQKKALEIVRKYKYPIKIFEFVEEKILSLPEEDRFDWRDIFELFHKPAVKDVELNFPKINEEKIKEILIERHDFSPERVEKQLEKLRDARKKQSQKGLGEWF